MYRRRWHEHERAASGRNGFAPSRAAHQKDIAMRVAINGMGIAGPTVAYWLRRSGTSRCSSRKRQRFDLVVGADGLHSRARAFAFGPEAQFEQFLDCYVAAFRVRGYPHRDELAFVSHTVRGRQAARVSLRDDETLVMLVFRAEFISADRLNTEILAQRFARRMTTWDGKCRKCSTRWTGLMTCTSIASVRSTCPTGARIVWRSSAMRPLVPRCSPAKAPALRCQRHTSSRELPRGSKLRCPMRHICTTVDIQAPPDPVWDAIRNVEYWSEWTPAIVSVRLLDPGPLTVGTRAIVRQPKLLPARWQVIELEEGRSFTWIMRGPGVRVTARHSVEGIANASRVTLSLDFSGPLGPVCARLTRGLNERYLALEARGLKRRAEEEARATQDRLPGVTR